MASLSENLGHDSSTLKDAVLALSYLAVGVHTVKDLFVKNYEKLVENFLEMQDISVDPKLKHDIKSLGEYVCENYIFKKNFESYFDDQAPFQLGETILTGSTSEGLFLFSTDAPDMDFMCVLKNIHFSQKDQEDGSLVLREDTAFVNAFLKTDKKTQHLWCDYLEKADKDGRHRLSSRKLKEKLEENYKKTGELFHTFNKEELEEVTEGAAVRICKPKFVIPSLKRFTEILKEFSRHPTKQPLEIFKLLHDKILLALIDKLLPSSDIVLAISCNGWPTCAKEWITRERLWPDKHQVQKIAQSGFHIVPKSSVDGDFRLSFSCAETVLIETLSPLQHKVMKAFKAVIKYHQEKWDPNFQYILSSYHLKTIAFWHFEKTSKKSWCDSTIVHHLVALLEDLAEALRTQTLPMYFMPKFNLFRDVGDPEMMVELMVNILQLSRNFSAMSEAVKSTLRKTSIAVGPFTLTPYFWIEKGKRGGLVNNYGYSGSHIVTQTSNGQGFTSSTLLNDTISLHGQRFLRGGLGRAHGSIHSFI